MKRLSAVFLSVVLAGTLAFPVFAAGADTSSYSFSGRNASADTWAEGDDGSYETVSFFGGNVTSKSVSSATKPERMKGAYGFVYKESYAPETATTPETLVGLWIFEEPAEFMVDRQLTSARLSFTAPAELVVYYDEMPWDCEEDPANPDEWICPEPDEVDEIVVDVACDWTGYGSLWRESMMWKSRTDGFFSIDRNNSTRRDATAVGSIIGDDGTVYFDGPLDWASIYDTKSGGHMKGMWPEY